jgi:hypothetical protein
VHFPAAENKPCFLLVDPNGNAAQNADLQRNNLFVQRLAGSSTVPETTIRDLHDSKYVQSMEATVSAKPTQVTCAGAGTIF